MHLCHVSPSLYLELSFSYHLTSPEPPACGNLLMPMATFTFRATRLMLGPGSRGRRSGLGRCPGVEQCILVDCVCMCVCAGARQLSLSVERGQVAGNRTGGKPGRVPTEPGPSIRRLSEVQEGSPCFFLDSKRREPS